MCLDGPPRSYLVSFSLCSCVSSSHSSCSAHAHSCLVRRWRYRAMRVSIVDRDFLYRFQHSGPQIAGGSLLRLDPVHSNSPSSLLIRDTDSPTISSSCEIVWTVSSHRAGMPSSRAYSHRRTISNTPSSRIIRSYSQTLIALAYRYSRPSTIHRLPGSNSSRPPRYVVRASISSISRSLSISHPTPISLSPRHLRVNRKTCFLWQFSIMHLSLTPWQSGQLQEPAKL